MLSVGRDEGYFYANYNHPRIAAFHGFTAIDAAKYFGYFSNSRKIMTESAMDSGVCAACVNDDSSLSLVRAVALWMIEPQGGLHGPHGLMRTVIPLKIYSLTL